MPRRTRAFTPHRLLREAHVDQTDIVRAPLVKGMNEESEPWRPTRVCDRLGAVSDVSCIRGNRILETIFYTLIFVPCSFALGALVDMMFPLSPADDCTSSWHTAWRAALQLVVAAVAVVYVRKLAHIARYSPVRCPHYKPHHHVNEYWGEVTLATVFIGTQRNLMTRIGDLRASVDRHATPKVVARWMPV
jgi:hypothetical protein